MITVRCALVGLAALAVTFTWLAVLSAPDAGSVQLTPESACVVEVVR